MKVTFECEVDLKEGERVYGVELNVLYSPALAFENDWKQAMLFIFHPNRGTKVREGKHLHLTSSCCTVVKVEETS